MKSIKVSIFFVVMSIFSNFALAEDNVERALRIHRCNHALYQETQ